MILTQNDGKIKVSGVCWLTKKEYTTEAMDLEDYMKWKDGELITKSLGYLSDDDREFLISGLSPKGYDKVCTTDSY